MHPDARRAREPFTHLDIFLARQLRERPTPAQRISDDRTPAVRPLIDPFDVLFEAELPRYELPEDLERIYGGIGFSEQTVYSNFVESLDGVASLGAVSSAGSIISGRNQPDRFLMGLLRACADAVLVGAGTLRATPGHSWTPEHIFPAMAASFAELRSRLGRKPQPRLVLLTASGDLDVAHPAVVAGATVVTSRAGAAKLHRRVPDSCDVMEIGESGDVDLAQAVAELRGRGYNLLLTEGGPHLLGALIKQDLLDQAFVTISPIVAGRDGDQRLGMIAGVELLPSRQLWSALMSARRHEDFLFLRYDLRKSASP